MGPGEKVCGSVVNLPLQRPCASAVAESVFLTDNLWLRCGTLIDFLGENKEGRIVYVDLEKFVIYL